MVSQNPHPSRFEGFAFNKQTYIFAKFFSLIVMGEGHLSWLSKEARAHNCWIYHTVSKKWYTPDEYDEAGIELTQRNGRVDRSHEFKIMSPQVGIEQRLKFLKKITDEFYEFKDRVDSYYSTELKKK